MGFGLRSWRFLLKETDEMAVKMVLAQFADGAWHNLAPQAMRTSFVSACLVSLKVGMAVRRGWMEQRLEDPTWVRLTQEGHAELRAMYGSDDRARHYRMMAAEFRTEADHARSKATRAGLMMNTGECERLAKLRATLLMNAADCERLAKLREEAVAAGR